MPRVVGIDPGTSSFDLCGLDDRRVFLDVSLETADVARSPAVIVDHMSAAGPLDLIVAPSGYGLPLVPIAELTDDQLNLFVLVGEQDRAQPEMVGGLRAIATLMRERHMPAVLMPGVIHLPTVPAHRKVNRIDMGTADKLCAVALGIWDQCRRVDLRPDATGFILVELGGAFSAAIAVDHGQIVDGIGGTSGGLGYRGLGTLDGEVAYVLGRVRKTTLFTGGAAFIAGDPGLPPAMLTARAPSDRSARVALDALLEAVEKMVASLRVSVPRAREVLLSGRLARVPSLVEALVPRLSHFAPVRVLTGFASGCGEAAQGAALLAEGLAGGENRELVATMRLRESTGTILDHLYMADAASARAQFGLP